jgi:hypothetical protein
MDAASFIAELDRNIDGIAPGSLALKTVFAASPRGDSLSVLTVTAHDTGVSAVSVLFN